MNGILNINKPAGITSHDVVSRVRKIAGMKKVGHTGTLDPFATGVLIVCLGKSTKIIRFLKDDKEYIGEIKLGIKTDTYDVDGNIVERGDISGVTDDRIREQAKNFIGDIEQTPPIYSAIKVNGKKMYELARAGEEVEVKKRSVTIYHLEVLHIELPFVKIKVRCSAGTYIRSIANDLGENLGCGGYLHTLVRTKVGDFSIENSVDLQKLNSDNIQEKLLNPNDFLAHLPFITMDNKETEIIMRGGFLENRWNVSGEWIRLLNAENKLIAIGEPRDDRIKPTRLLV